MHGRCEAVLLQLTKRFPGDTGQIKRAFLMCRIPYYIMDTGFVWPEPRHSAVISLSSHRRLLVRHWMPAPRKRHAAATATATAAAAAAAAAASNDDILEGSPSHPLGRRAGFGGCAAPAPTPTPTPMASSDAEAAGGSGSGESSGEGSEEEGSEEEDTEEDTEEDGEEDGEEGGELAA